MTKAWSAVAKAPAVDLTPVQVLDMLRRLIESGKGRTANKLRSYPRACAPISVHWMCVLAAIPVAFKAFGVVFNPAALTRRSPQFDRADKRPLTLAEMKAYWKLIVDHPGIEAAALRLHLLTGGQRIEQFIRLKCADVDDDAMTLFDGKGRPSQGPRSHQVPLVPMAATDLKRLACEGEYVFSTTKGKKPISARTLTDWAHEIVGSEIEGFQLKRIRSGVETLLAREGVSHEVRGHLQSHGLTGVQTMHYDGHDYLPEKLLALKYLVEVIDAWLKRKSYGPILDNYSPLQ